MKTVLAFQPSAWQLGYAVFKDSSLVERGAKHLAFLKPVRQRTYRVAVPFFRGLVEKYSPDIIVFPNPTKTPDTARNRFLRAMKYEKVHHQYFVVSIGRKDIRQTFKVFLKTERVNKDSIMLLLTKWFPELLEFLPKPRRIWETPAYWVSMFDAVSLVITYLHHNE
jgi:hypothetical protein